MNYDANIMYGIFMRREIKAAQVLTTKANVAYFLSTMTFPLEIYRALHFA
jgi:hypothetical protein